LVDEKQITIHIPERIILFINVEKLLPLQKALTKLSTSLHKATDNSKQISCYAPFADTWAFSGDPLHRFAIWIRQAAV